MSNLLDELLKLTAVSVPNINAQTTEAFNIDAQLNDALNINVELNDALKLINEFNVEDRELKQILHPPELAAIAGGYNAEIYLNKSFLNDILPPSIPSPAEAMYHNLIQQIAEFEAGLAPDHEVGGRFVAAPADGVIHIESLDYRAPNLIIFYGTNEQGGAVRLVQHCSQLSVSLSAVPKQKEKPRRIGFYIDR